MQQVKYLPNGDLAVSVEFGNEISPEINERIRAFRIAIEKSQIPGIVETVPTYRSLLVYYQPEQIGFRSLIERFQELMDSLDCIVVPPPSVIEIPVLYGGEFGPDLKTVAEYHHSSEENVIRIHTSREYLIYMIGFIAGFPYLGGMSEEIATPRLREPRVKIAGGSVGIAGQQTGIYPIDSPGGWQLIGRTPLKLYDPDREQPILLSAGQYIRFRSISEKEFSEIAASVANGTYCYQIHKREVE